MARIISLLDAVFANSALTTIPSTPIPGVSYRNTAILETAVEEGWPYSEVVDSATFNQIMYRIASLLNEVEKQGILEWSTYTNYGIGSFTRGSTDNKLYQAILASGPDEIVGVKDPDIGANPTYWLDTGLGGSGGGGGGTLSLALINTILSSTAGGRLTLTSGTPVTTSDVINANNIYYTPNTEDSNYLALYNGSTWDYLEIVNKAISLSGTTSATAYDIFAFNNSNVVDYEIVQWASSNVRSIALTTQNNILVKSGTPTKRYIGSFRTTNAGQCSDANGKRFLWNMYNRVPARNLYASSLYSWSYSSTAYRLIANDSNYKHEFFFGLSDASLIDATVHSYAAATTSQPWTSIGFNSLTPSLGTLTSLSANSIPVASVGVPSMTANGQGYLGLGYGYVAGVEKISAGTSVTFYGSSISPLITRSER